MSDDLKFQLGNNKSEYFSEVTDKDTEDEGVAMLVSGGEDNKEKRSSDRGNYFSVIVNHEPRAWINSKKPNLCAAHCLIRLCSLPLSILWPHELVW